MKVQIKYLYYNEIIFRNDIKPLQNFIFAEKN